MCIDHIHETIEWILKAYSVGLGIRNTTCNTQGSGKFFNISMLPTETISLSNETQELVLKNSEKQFIQNQYTTHRINLPVQSHVQTDFTIISQVYLEERLIKQ